MHLYSDGDAGRQPTGVFSVPVASAALSPCGVGGTVLHRQLGPPSVQGLAI